MSNGNTGKKGEFFFRIEQRTGDDAKTKCNTWFEFQEELKGELLAADRFITPCPCVLSQVRLDWRFDTTDAIHFKSVRKRVIDISVSTGEQLIASIHRRCAYDFRTGGSIREEDSTLEVLYRTRPSNLVEDSTARQLCLIESNSVGKFNRVRLPNNCDRFFLFPILRSKLLKKCWKNSQQCFIGFKTTRLRLVGLDPIKHVLRVF